MMSRGEQLLEDLRRVLTGKLCLRTVDYQRGGGKFGINSFVRHLGSWQNALYLAGLVSEASRSKEVTLKTCLGCDHEFLSEGSWNRICSNCANSEWWKASRATTYQLVVPGVSGTGGYAE